MLVWFVYESQSATAQSPAATLSRDIKSRNKIARSNHRCDIGLTAQLHCLPTAAAGKVMRSVVSVRSSVSFEPSNL